MLLSQTAEYALRAVVFLAGHPQEPQTTKKIAQATGVPGGYLAKILQTLGRAGFVHSQRGLGGGFTLARQPQDLSVLDIINAVDTFARIKQCPMGLEGHGPHLCHLHRKLDDALASIEKTFRSTSVQELIEHADDIPSTCHP